MKDIEREILKIARELTAGELPVGYFLVVRPFRIGFGSWGLKFHRGDIIQSERRQEGHLYSWSEKRGKWIERVPPISGRNNFQLSSYGDYFDQKKQLGVFNRSVEEISLQEVEEIIMDKQKVAKELLILARELISKEHIDNAWGDVPSDDRY